MPDEVSPPPAQPHRGIPVFWQILGLCLMVLLVAISVETALVLYAPPPTPHGYRLQDVVIAFKTGQARLADGTSIQALPVRDFGPPSSPRPAGSDMPGQPQPDFDLPPLSGHGRFLEAFLESRLTLALGTPPGSLRVEILPDTGRLMVQIQDTRQGESMSALGQGAHLGELPRHEESRIVVSDWLNDMDAVPRAMAGRDFNLNLTFPPFRAVWKRPDGQVFEVRPPPPAVAPWQWRLIIGFGLCALAIVPVAWWMSRRISQPLSRLAQAAEGMRFDDSPDATACFPDAGPPEIKALARTLERLRDRLKDHVEQKTAMMSAIAHDLKTPLARMRLRVEPLSDHDRDRLIRDIGDMTALIDQALGYARAGRLGEQLERINLSSLTDALCADLGGAPDGAKIATGVEVMGDVIAIRRVLNNLIDNAVRYGGRWGLSLKSENGQAVLVINDKGPGIADHQLTAVFEPFVRLDPSRNRETGGAGLGLSVARALCQAMNAKIALENRYRGNRIIGLQARVVFDLVA